MIESSQLDARQNWRQFWRSFFSLVFTRGFLVGLLLVGEALLILALINNLFDTSTVGVYIGVLAFSVIAVVYLLSQPLNSSFKLSWAIFILLTPPTGAIIYLTYELMGRLTQHRGNRQKWQEIWTNFLRANTSMSKKIAKLPQGPRQQAHYLSRVVGFPVYERTSTHYFPLGEDFFAQLKKDLHTAQKFIFLEYYIITPGVMWQEILDILCAKASAGVEVRVMYDDVGCLFSLPTNYARQLQAMGIKTIVNNRFRPLIAFQMNNRDHRKIAIVDGKIGYTGGLNLADEYINLINRYGHWKDTAIRLEGTAVNTLTMTFLQMWNLVHITDLDFNQYLCHTQDETKDDGVVIPYADDPTTHENVGKNVYLNMINKARESIYITTPYLVPDDDLVTCLTLAAKNGVDVRLIIPTIGDHWYVHVLSQACCLPLLEAGCQVYEYSPGFMHSKTMLVDGEQAVIGSVNLDYRSLYMLYEASVYTYHSQAVEQLQTDFIQTLKKCRRVELSDIKETHWTTKIIRSFLRLIAPLV
ncbi:cardiolipin synthase [bacterium]|nr:cardiolipin synthase [bacterium]